MDSTHSEVQTENKKSGKKVFLTKKTATNHSGNFNNPLNKSFFKNHVEQRAYFQPYSGAYHDDEFSLNSKSLDLDQENIYGEIDNLDCGQSDNDTNISKNLPNPVQGDSSSNNRVPVNGVDSHVHFQSNNNGDKRDNPVSSMDNTSKLADNGENKNGLTLPTVARYKLKNKIHRHVYHDITLPHEKVKLNSDQSAGNNARLPQKRPPPLPFKPHYLRGDYRGENPPPVPPKILNRVALIQRKQLNEEYFENIRRCIDDDNIEDDIADSYVPGHIATPSVQITSDPNQASTSAVSVQVPGTEKNPYWTIKDHPQSLLPTTTGNEMSPGRPMSTSFNEKPKENDIFLQPKPQTFPALTTTSHYHLIQSLKSLKRCGWYWGNMQWEDAEAMLEQRPGEEGLFLVRDSQDPLHILTLTVRSSVNTIHHIRIEHTDGKFQLYEPSGGVSRGAADCVRNPNIATFIKLAMKHSKSGTFIYFVKTRNMGEPPVQIRLLNPISRFACVKSLKYYCRFVIRDTFPLEAISQLPIPTKLKTYVSKPQYFDPDEDFKCALVS